MLDRRDEAHHACSRLLTETGEPRVVPAPVLVEVDHFVPSHVFVRFLEDVDRGAFQVIELTATDLRRVGELLAAYSDLRIGFVDAAVLAVVERFNESKLATLDRRHFTIMRPRHVSSLDLVPSR